MAFDLDVTADGIVCKWEREMGICREWRSKEKKELAVVMTLKKAVEQRL